MKDSFTVERHEGILNATKANGRIVGNAASITTIAEVEGIENPATPELNEAEELNLRSFPYRVNQWEDIDTAKTDDMHNIDTYNAPHMNLSKATEPQDAVWAEPTVPDVQEDKHAAEWELIETGNQVDTTQDNMNIQSSTTSLNVEFGRKVDLIQDGMNMQSSTAALNPGNQTVIQNSNLPSEQSETSQTLSQIDIMYGFVKEQILAEKMKKEKSRLVTESVSTLSIEKDASSQPKSICLPTDLVKNSNVGENHEAENATWKVKERLVKTTIEKKSNS
jgi:hypothetical protein